MYPVEAPKGICCKQKKAFPAKAARRPKRDPLSENMHPGE